MSKTAELVRTVGLIGLGRLSTQVVALALLPVYTTFLSPSEYGIIDLFMTYVTLLSPAFTLQIEFGMFRFLINSRGRRAETISVVTTALVALGTLATVWMVIGAILATISAERLWFYFLVLLGSGMAFSVASQLARGLGNNRLYAVASIVVSASTVILVSAFVAFGLFNFDTYFWLIPGCSVLGTLVVLIGASVHKHVRLASFSRARLVELLRYSVPLIPNSISWWAINASGRTVAAVFLGVASVGVYAVATKFASIVTGLATVFSYAWMESASMHIDAPDRPKFFSQVVDEALRVFAAITILVVSLVPLVFGLLVDDTFKGAYLFIPILLVGALSNSMVGFYSGVLIAQKDTKRVAATSVAAAIVSIALSFSLVQPLGLYAIAIGPAIAFTVMAVYRHITVRSTLGIRFRWSTLIVVPTSLAVSLLLYYVHTPPLSGVLVGVALSSLLIYRPLAVLARAVSRRRRSRP